VSEPAGSEPVVSENLERLRAIAVELPPAPPAMAAYLAKVRERAYAVTDGDVDALRAAGHSEDEIFEQTVKTAIGEGLRRLGAAERVLG
jgi:alkylhydroperoxidase family enzyme